MGTKDNPGEFDCYAKAEPDEPIFVLLGRDAAAPAAIAKWVHERIAIDKNQHGDPQIAEALECIRNMRIWRRSRKEKLKHGK